MATLVISVLNKYYNEKDFSPINSVFGSLEIDDMYADSIIVEEFNAFLVENKADINEHIKLLFNALASYYENDT